MSENGEPDRIRTCDPLIKSQLLYQLSYTNIIHYLEDTLRLQPTPVDLVHPAKESRT